MRRPELDYILTTMLNSQPEVSDLLFAVEPDNVENVKNLYFAEELPASSRAGKNVKSEKKGKKAKAKAAGR